MNQRNKKTTIISTVAALLIVVIGLAAAAYALTLEIPKKESAADSSKSHGSEADDASLANKKASVVITYGNDGFDPIIYVVKSGDVVEVKNTSKKEFYFTTGDHENHDMHSPLSLGTIKPGESANFVAPEPGTYKFHNHDNQAEIGALTVQ